MLTTNKIAASTRDRATTIQQAFVLEYVTIAWMLVEAAVAIGSGVAANSLTLIAFGVDSVIELASALVYIVASACWKLWVRESAEFSLPGLIVSVLAIPIMYLLSREKLKLAAALGSRALRADAIESITCGWLSTVVVVALGAQLVLGAWWVDAVASLGIVWFLVREASKAWRGKECCDDRLSPC